MEMIEKLYMHLPALAQDFVFSGWGLNERLRRRGRAYSGMADELRRLERDEEQLQRVVDERFVRVVRHAYEQSPFYRQLYDEHGVDVAAIKSAEDATSLPTIDKEMVRANYARIMTSPRAPRRATAYATSGTTGTPLKVLVDHDRVDQINACWDFHRSWAGVARSEVRGLRIGGKPFSTDPNVSRPWRVIQPLGIYYVGSYYLTDQNIPRVIDLMRRKNVRYIESFPSSLLPLANWIASRGENFALGAIFTGSETVTPKMRSLFESTFGCPVYDLYGQVEKVNVIAQCEAGGYHDFSTFGSTELVPSPEGGNFRMVATALTNFQFPLIRYETGDVARPGGGCECGRGLPHFDSIDGRVDDLIVTPDGRYVWALDQVVRPVPVILKAQILQDQLDHLVLRYVAPRELESAEKQVIIQEFRLRTGDSMHISFERRDSIPLTSGGKHRYVISNVNQGGGFH